MSTQGMTLNITFLSNDLLRNIFSFLTASDLDNGVAYTCKVLRRASLSSSLWRDLCIHTGKTNSELWGSDEPPQIGSDYYFRLYHSAYCVPLDCATIKDVLDMGSSKPTITIMPGVHEERLVLKNSQVVTIRAADYRRGAALVWYHPCQNHSVNGTSADSVCSHCGHGINESVIEVEDGACLSIHNLTLLHYTEGTDLWHGNSAVYCHGNSTSIHMEGCSIQSDSGRGLVVSNGADVHVNRSTIHDCAATGAYIGDDGSYLGLGFSNVLRNGFGTRRPILDNDNNNGPHPPRIQAGHSGIYVEATVCSISHSFVALNCFTGLSVVRDSDVYLSKCHFAGNGEEPVIVFQDDDDDIDEDVDNPLASVSENSNVYDAAIPPLEQMERTMLRCNHVYHRPLSPEILQVIFGA